MAMQPHTRHRANLFILAQFVLLSYGPTCTSFEPARQVDGLACITGYDKDHNCCILNHRTVSPRALFDVLVLDGGRGKTLSDLVDRDRELPANKAIHTNTCAHTQKYIINAHRWRCHLNEKAYVKEDVSIRTRN